ncbi:hypothetical protein CHS0354_041029 [Potamilus streckersoni]|uniref:Uncharacterized protein n=1 Tax=Potamilus streckersoni TaxID=2493646 RepID=A0AAE0W2Z8_9BIVA|nr:hypothetical protein CHS0354_041029 [Potamilus streckersoni]
MSVKSYKICVSIDVTQVKQNLHQRCQTSQNKIFMKDVNQITQKSIWNMIINFKKSVFLKMSIKSYKSAYQRCLSSHTNLHIKDVNQVIQICISKMSIKSYKSAYQRCQSSHTNLHIKDVNQVIQISISKMSIKSYKSAYQKCQSSHINLHIKSALSGFNLIPSLKIVVMSYCE